MEITGPGGVGGPPRIGADRKPARIPSGDSAARVGGDKVEISSVGRHIEALKALPDVRDPERIAELRRQIKEGRYLDDRKVADALDRMFKEELGF